MSDINLLRTQLELSPITIVYHDTLHCKIVSIAFFIFFSIMLLYRGLQKLIVYTSGIIILDKENQDNV